MAEVKIKVDNNSKTLNVKYSTEGHRGMKIGFKSKDYMVYDLEQMRKFKREVERWREGTKVEIIYVSKDNEDSKINEALTYVEDRIGKEYICHTV